MHVCIPLYALCCLTLGREVQGDLGRDTIFKLSVHTLLQLALKLHPDKCQLGGAEDAFKKVSLYPLYPFCAPLRRSIFWAMYDYPLYSF